MCHYKSKINLVLEPEPAVCRKHKLRVVGILFMNPLNLYYACIGERTLVGAPKWIEI